MGADGHIQIYNLTLIQSYLGERWKRLREATSDARIYEHEFKTPSGDTIPVLTRYWGDNLYYDGLWTALAYYSEVGKIRDNAESYYHENIPDADLLQMAADVKWIEQNARIGQSWEVWT